MPDPGKSCGDPCIYAFGGVPIWESSCCRAVRKGLRTEAQIAQDEHRQAQNEINEAANVQQAWIRNNGTSETPLEGAFNTAAGVIGSANDTLGCLLSGVPIFGGKGGACAATPEVSPISTTTLVVGGAVVLAVVGGGLYLLSRS